MEEKMEIFPTGNHRPYRQEPQLRFTGYAPVFICISIQWRDF